MHEEERGRPGLDRRRALQLIGGTIGAAVLAGCGGSSSTSSAGGATSTTGGSTASTAVTPEGEIGPYFTDDTAAGYNRSSIVANLDGSDVQTGIPFTLKVFVYDSEAANAPVVNAQVDIWHCNPTGVYSNESSESTVGQSWLRGYQLTDSTGQVTFNTIIPGWYSGRTTHYHLRVRSKYSEASSTTDGTNTTQLFFPQSVINEIATNVAPYSSQGANPTTNATDRVYATETLAKNEMSISGSVSAGYTATFSIYLPITSE